MKTIQAAECRAIRARACDYIGKSLSRVERASFEEHLQRCSVCSEAVNSFKQVDGLLQQAFCSNEVSQKFTERLSTRFDKMVPDGASLAAIEPPTGSSFDAWRAQLDSAPWWVVSVLLHALVIALAGLISMAVELPRGEDVTIMVTELTARPPITVIETKKEETSALHSRQETPPTDPTSKEACDVIVPPELLAQAQLSDHFETINPDRPDTQSAFGNPEAQMFHSARGSDDEEGGGGANGLTLTDSIGVGAAGSPGTGGGWGGGNGTGVGTGNGRGTGSFGSRGGGGRKLLVKRHGGNKATEDAVEKALDWLARHQEADGSWNATKTEAQGLCAGSDPGITGLAVLAFLGAGHTEKTGKYREHVQKAIAFIIAQQGKNGEVGWEPKWRGHHTLFSYTHAICGMALAEAAGMARIKETFAAAQKAIDYTSNVMQCGEGSDRLGWRYQPKEAVGDMSVSGWFVMQLKSAKIAGLKVDGMSFDGALNFMKTREEDAAKIQREDSAYDNGRFRYGYTEKGSLPNTTAIGLLCQLFCGTRPEECQGAAMWLLRTNPPAWNDRLGMGITGTFPMYYTYYTSLTMFQMGGDLWKKWNDALKKMLCDNQRRDGDFAGSWDPMGLEKFPGRAYTTALGCMSLEIYYRYLRLHDAK